MILETFSKQPAERKDYDIDYAEWLAPMDDTLHDIDTTVECLTDATNASLSVVQIDMTATTAKLWVTGGTDGQKYKVTVNATSSGTTSAQRSATPPVTVVQSRQRIDQSELIFKVKDY